MEILNKRISGSFTETEGDYVYTGSFQQDENEVLQHFSCTVSRGNPEPEVEAEPIPVGDIMSFQRGNKIALTYNGFNAAIIAEIASMAETLVEELGGNIDREGEEELEETSY